jgi:hypothetical protein
MAREGCLEGNNVQGGQRKNHHKCAMQSLQRKQAVTGEWKEGAAAQKENWREMAPAIMDGSGARTTGAAAKTNPGHVVKTPGSLARAAI